MYTTSRLPVATPCEVSLDFTLCCLVFIYFWWLQTKVRGWEPVHNYKDSFLCYFISLSLLCNVWTFLLNSEVTVLLQCVFVEICFDMACVEDLCFSYSYLVLLSAWQLCQPFVGEERWWGGFLHFKTLCFLREICPAFHRDVWESRVLPTVLLSSWSDFFQDKEIGLETLKKICCLKLEASTDQGCPSFCLHGSFHGVSPLSEGVYLSTECIAPFPHDKRYCSMDASGATAACTSQGSAILCFCVWETDGWNPTGIWEKRAMCWKSLKFAGFLWYSYTFARMYSKHLVLLLVTCTVVC